MHNFPDLDGATSAKPARRAEVSAIPLWARFVRALLRTGIRGTGRLTSVLATRFKTLQVLPIRIGDSIVYSDLRTFSGKALLTYGLWETAEQSVMERCVSPGSVVYDVGANIGTHTILLATVVGPHGKVFAFEPNEMLRHALSKTIVPFENTTLLPFALGDRRHEAVFFVPPLDAHGSIVNWTGIKGRKMRQLRCEVYAIDDLIASGRTPIPDFIKCDVEGAELLVFKGARHCLTGPMCPLILFESYPLAMRGLNLEVDAVFRLLTELIPDVSFYEIVATSETEGTGTLRRITAPPNNLCNILAVPLNRQEILRTARLFTQ